MLTSQLGRMRTERRGIILVVILAMLALFATIGVLVAVISKVEGAGARNFKKAEQDPHLAGQGSRTLARSGTFDAQALLAEAINQLIFDTNNEQSAIRGHSLMRSMYGGPDAEIRPAAPTAGNPAFPFYGVFNGTGHFAPRDYPSYTPVNDPASGIPVASLTANIGVINNAKTAYGLYRLRPPGDPAGWPVLWNMPNNALLQPILPFNLTVYDAVGSGATLRAATPQIGPAGNLENQQPEKFWDGAAWHYFAKDVDYTAADHNHWYLALERADGQIVLPSFHRPHLVAQLEAAGVFGTTTAPNGSTSWRHAEGRRVIFRPRAIDVSPEATTGVNFIPPANVQIGQPFRDLQNLDDTVLPGTTVPIIGDSPQELDVDTDGDGIRDAIWVDLGVRPTVRLPDGGLAKPLFAFKVISMDGKINLNTAGNYRTMLDENGAALANRPRHSSNLGASPAEINPKHAFLLDETSTSSAGGTGPRIPNWQAPGFYTWMNFGRQTAGVSNYGRWNGPEGSGIETPLAVDPLTVVLPTRVGAADGIGIGPGAITPNANVEDPLLTVSANLGLRSLTDLWSGYDQFGFGRSFEPFSAAPSTAYPPTFSPFKDVLGLQINIPRFGVKSTLPLSAFTQPPLTDEDLKLESALQAIPYDAAVDRLHAAEQAARDRDYPFSAADVERLFRYFDIDGSIQSPRLTQLLEEAFSSRTTDLNPASPNYTERQYARNRMRRLFTHASWDLIHMGTPPVFPESVGVPGTLPEDSSKQDTTPPSATYAARHNGRIGVGSTSIPATPFHTPAIIGAAEGFGQTTNGHFGTRLPIEVRHGRRYNLNKILDSYATSPATADQQRSDMAEQIYLLLWLAVRPIDRYPGGPGTPAYDAANRIIAQIAVNIVDYIDVDDVMTRLIFPTAALPTDATSWQGLTPNANSTNVVFGFELPKVVINEAVAVRAQRPVGSPTADRIWMWAELHNPWPRDANASSPLDAQLAAGGPAGTPIYRLRVSDGSFSGDCGFVEGDSAHGAGAPAALINQVVGAKGTANNYFVVGPSRGVDAMDPDDPTSVLANYVGPTIGADNGTINGRPIQFAADCMYQASSAPSSATREISFTLMRLRNPFAAGPTPENPYVVIDSMVCNETTPSNGLYLVNGPSAISEDQRFSRARRQPWQGESLAQATLTNAPFGASAPGATNEQVFLGVPLATTPIDSGFVPSATSGGTANTLGDDNLDVNVNQVYSSFPFMNRPLASPLELLSVRLYGSHFWPTAPSGVTGGEWRLRFTDDYQFYTVNSTTPVPPLQRVWRSRQSPWFMDSELGLSFQHPENGGPYAQSILPNLHRFFEFVECRSLLNGSLDPVANETEGFPSGLGQAGTTVYNTFAGDPRIDPRRSRAAGKICLNTIADEEVFRALLDAPEAMPATALPGNFDAQSDLPTPLWHPAGYLLDPFRRIYVGELVGSRWNLTGGPIDFGGINITPAPNWVIPLRQWGAALTNGPRLAAVYPGRHPDDLVAGEMYRMFLLSRAGRDGILGTGDDKPFRGFASDRLSDTILRRRNFRMLDYPQDRTVATADGFTEDQQAEYLVSLHGQYSPRLFDPIGNPYNRPNATGGAIDPADPAQARIDHKLELDAKFGFTPASPLPAAAVDQVDYWMLERRRNQLLGKIAGNSTTRSNVFGVWVTVGLFRVQAGAENNLVPLLNEEVGSNTGEQVRHRAFFIVDRSRMERYDAAMIRSRSLDDDDLKRVIQHYTIME